MDLDKLAERIVPGKAVLLESGELEALLAAARIVEERDTLVSGLIRILEWKGRVLVQEFTDKEEPVLRETASLEEARRFVEERMRTYEKMWDGCGCKVDYFE